MGQHLNWIQFIIVFMMLLGIQFITRIKAVADGMVFRELMVDHNMDVNEIVQKIKEQAEEAKRNNDINWYNDSDNVSDNVSDDASDNDDAITSF